MSDVFKDNPDGSVSIDVGKMKLVTLDEANELRAEVAKLREECAEKAVMLRNFSDTLRLSMEATARAREEGARSAFEYIHAELSKRFNWPPVTEKDIEKEMNE